MADGPSARLRVDKWLWQARFFKTRSKAGTVAGSGRLRINGERCEKPAQTVRPGDVLTFPQERLVRVIRVEALGTRRGPATEAQGLYTDLEPPPVPGRDQATQEGQEGTRGRPDRDTRREILRLRRDAP